MIDNKPKFRDPRRLSPEDARQMPPWLRHFFIFVAKPIAAIIVSWCDQMKEAFKEYDSD